MMEVMGQARQRFLNATDKCRESLVGTTGNVGLAVGRLFVKETFRETAKNDVSFNVGTKQPKK
jgi:predicted metalloendopeptidase